MKPELSRLAALGILALVLPACGIGGSGGTLTPTVAPAIPDNVELRPGNRSATITWSESAAGSTYIVSRSLNPRGPFFPVSVPGQFRTPTSYVDPGLQNGTDYHYQVVATNSFGSSPPSTVVSGTPGFKATAISGGTSLKNSMALLRDGTVWEWGENANVGLGEVPTQKSDLFDITAIACGFHHSLALGSDGSVWVWGNNSFGMVGDPGLLGGYVTVPYRVPELTNAIGVAAGEQHSMALTQDGTVWVWGNNNQGEFGDGTSIPSESPVPVQVPNLTGIVAITAGSGHNLALRNDGLVFSWGYNSNGQLGNGTIGTPPGPAAQVPNLNGVVAIASGLNHNLALRNDGTVWAWGVNALGQLGLGTLSTEVAVPTKTLNLTGITAVACSSVHSLAVRNDGTVWSWGYNMNGQLGNGTSGAPVSTPAKVQGLTRAALVAACGFTSTAVDEDGSVWAWGDNSRGNLGTGTGSTAQVPIELPNFTGATAIAGGDGSSLAARTTGAVWGWGKNNAGQLGNGASSATPTVGPGPSTVLTTATAVAAGITHGLARQSNGTVWGWGSTSNGQVGNGATGTLVLNPVQLAGPTGIGVIATGLQNSYAVRSSDGALWGWGYDTWGQLGQGAGAATRPSPVLFPGVTGVAAVAGGDRHTVFAKTDGTVWVCGANDKGQLGLGVAGTTMTPVQVPGISGAVSVGAGIAHTVVVLGDGTVRAWGSGDSSQLGDGLSVDSNVPVTVSGLTGVIAVACGYRQSVALKSDGTVWMWGNYTPNPLIAPGPISSPIPVQILNLGSAVEVASGANHALARLSNGTVWSWGSNGSNELGIAVVAMSTVPVQITH